MFFFFFKWNKCIFEEIHVLKILTVFHIVYRILNTWIWYFLCYFRHLHIHHVISSILFTFTINVQYYLFIAVEKRAFIIFMMFMV